MNSIFNALLRKKLMIEKLKIPKITSKIIFKIEFRYVTSKIDCCKKYV